MDPARVEAVDVERLTIGDVLVTPGGGTYVVRQIHFEWMATGRGNYKRYTYHLVGFTLLEVQTVTDREVGLEELRKQLKERTMYLYRPPVVRRMQWRKVVGSPKSLPPKAIKDHVPAPASTDYSTDDDRHSITDRSGEPTTESESDDDEF